MASWKEGQSSVEGIENSECVNNVILVAHRLVSLNKRELL